MSCDLNLLHRIAHKYYIEGLSQQQISVQENVSRPHISRLLARAKELGIVQITVSLPDEFYVSSLAEQISEKLGLDSVEIAELIHSSDPEIGSISKSIAVFAANKLESHLGDAKTVGIGWGKTIYQTSLELHDQVPHPDMTFVPLVGMSDETKSYQQNNVIVNRFAERYKAKSFYTSVPALNYNQVKRHQLEADRYERLNQWWNKLDLAVIGLGPRFQRGDFLINEASDRYKRFIAESEVVADILASFFYADGTVLQSTAYYEIVSLPLAKLKNIKKVICLAGGQEKVPGIIAAAKCGFFSTLFTDLGTAERILEYEREISR
jgi:DNA-binding transcriptional regulator LsrR (DeoR family)